MDTIEDIDILRDAGIIKQVKGGNEEVVNLLNSLSKHLEFDINDCCITEKIEREVQKHHAPLGSLFPLSRNKTKPFVISLKKAATLTYPLNHTTL